MTTRKQLTIQDCIDAMEKLIPGWFQNRGPFCDQEGEVCLATGYLAPTNSRFGREVDGVYQGGDTVLIPADVSLHEELLESKTRYLVEEKRGFAKYHVVIDTETATERDAKWIDDWLMDQLADNGIHDPVSVEYSIHVTYTTQEEHECER